MVNFNLNNEQIELRNLSHNFALKEIKPKANFYDETGEWPIDILKKAWKLGLINCQIPKAYNGFGLSCFNSAIISEELGWGCTGISTAITANALGQFPVILAGTAEQKKQWLVPFAKDHIICSYAVTESIAGSDVAALQSTAIRKNDKYILNGHKMWITGAGHANWYFVLAKTDVQAGYKGMSAFIVPRDLPGITIGKKENNMGQRASDTRSIIFDNVEIPIKNLLGKEGDGFLIAMKAFDHSRPLVAASAIGLSRSAMEYSISYAGERKAFGVPISKHEGISFMIADMASDIEAGRFLVWNAALKVDSGKRNTLSAAYAKRFSADIAMRIATDAVQVFGGSGFNKEYPVEKLMRDAKIFQIYEGTSQIQRVIIARELFKIKMLK